METTSSLPFQRTLLSSIHLISENVLRVTALHDNTKIKVFYKTTQKDLDIYLAGQTQIVHISDSSEVNQLGISNTAVRITSDKKITVVSISQRAGSTQTNVVQPTVNLGTEYLIPLLDYPGYLESFNLPRSVSSSTRYSSFKLLISMRWAVKIASL